jgi:hypothetical protein
MLPPFWSENLKGRDYFRGLGADGRPLVKLLESRSSDLIKGGEFLDLLIE